MEATSTPRLERQKEDCFWNPDRASPSRSCNQGGSVRPGDGPMEEMWLETIQRVEMLWFSSSSSPPVSCQCFPLAEPGQQPADRDAGQRSLGNSSYSPFPSPPRSPGQYKVDLLTARYLFTPYLLLAKVKKTDQTKRWQGQRAPGTLLLANGVR